MKKLLIVLIHTFLYSNLLYSQTQSYNYYSKLIVDSIAKSEIKFLDEIEKEVDNYAKNSNTKKYADINGILNPMTNEEFSYINQKTSKSSKYQNYLIWNSLFDNAYFMSFTRVYEDTSAKAASRDYTRFIIPLDDYKAFLDSNRLNDFKNIILKYLKHEYSISQYDSISISTVKLDIDSTRVLAQASISKFSELLFQATSNGDLPVFGSPTINDLLTFGQWNSITSSPFTIISGDQTISTRKMHEALSILIVTQWEIIPAQTNLQVDYLQPTFQISRKISSVGLEFENQKCVFYKYEDIKTFCDKSNLSFEAFNQIFISYSLDKLAIQYK